MNDDHIRASGNIEDDDIREVVAEIESALAKAASRMTEIAAEQNPGQDLPEEAIVTRWVVCYAAVMPGGVVAVAELWPDGQQEFESLGLLHQALYRSNR